jgi:hypothetical protein
MIGQPKAIARLLPNFHSIYRANLDESDGSDHQPLLVRSRLFGLGAFHCGAGVGGGCFDAQTSAVCAWMRRRH